MASSDKDDLAFYQKCRQRLELVQVILAILALTNFNVQIINRISSGYPLWYIRLASEITMADASPTPTKATKEEKPGAHYRNWLGMLPSPKLTVRMMVMYAIIQAGLYASFMPPA